MQLRRRGFTMVEMFAALLAICLLAGTVWAWLHRRERHRGRPRCANNISNLIKCCHLYSDAGPNLGHFPLVDEEHNAHGQSALAKLQGAYVKDLEVYVCPGPARAHSRGPRTTEAALIPGVPDYGYDPGHTPTHATAGVIGDYGLLQEANHRNSTNHGYDGPGQYVAIGAGSVEWWDAADSRPTRDSLGGATTDDIFADNWDLDLFPEELETNIIP